jgi:hypothetical protein
MMSRVQPRPEFLAAFYLTFLELSLINSAVVLFSTFVSGALAATFTICLFVIGHLSESIMQFGQLVGGSGQALTSRILYFVVPNLEIFNIRGAVVHGEAISEAHLGLATLYGTCYTALLLLVACHLFARKEFK